MRRLCRTWCAHAVNACHFRRANAWHYGDPKATPALKAVRTVQGASSTERLVRVRRAPTCIVRPECRASRHGTERRDNEVEDSGVLPALWPADCQHRHGSTSRPTSAKQAQ